MTRDAQEGETAAVSGWSVTAAIAPAQARRLLDQGETFDAVSMDPRADGALDLVVKLAERAGCGVHLRTSADDPRGPLLARDPGVIGVGPATTLAPRPATVTLTTALRVAWVARASVAFHVLTPASPEIVLYVVDGEPVDARSGDDRGLEALAALVPNAACATARVRVEYQTTPPSRTIACGMAPLLDLLDDDAPYLEIEIDDSEVVAPRELAPRADDIGAYELVTHASGLPAALEVVLLDASGGVVAASGWSRGSAPAASFVWGAVALVHQGAAVEDVVIVTSDAIDVLRPVLARVLHVRFCRDEINVALARYEVERVCRVLKA